jgi:hypothetical protein
VWLDAFERQWIPEPLAAIFQVFKNHFPMIFRYVQVVFDGFVYPLVI